jgi:hypothetical protein
MGAPFAGTLTAGARCVRPSVLPPEMTFGLGVSWFTGTVESLGAGGERAIAGGFGPGATCVPPDAVSGTDGVGRALVCASAIGDGRAPPA